MRIAILVLGLLCAPQALALPTLPVQEQVEDEDGPKTIGAIVSRNPVDVSLPWRPSGAGRTLKVDYDQDGVLDVAQLMTNGRHAAVRVTSGKTGKTSNAWLIDNRNGLAPDVHIAKAGKHSIKVVFPESTEIHLFRDAGKPMATYLNG
ncbi:hypothetical protein [Sphingomonas sp. 3-13AW]|uniref:hypothetical protein n=1 Tax=Sphingomonas sp. 3-13AW TaxID=3050450 RepID=UPI003BB4D8C0